MERLKKIAAFIAARWKWFLTIGAGWSIDRLSNWLFEYVLYPVVINTFDLIKGGGIMVIASIIISLATIWVYDKTRKDWLGIEAIKILRDGEGKGKMARAIRWLLRKGDLIALVGLSLISEPVKVMLYLRRGVNNFNGFKKRDWLVFITAVVISNASWTLVVFGGLEAFKKLLT